MFSLIAFIFFCDQFSHILFQMLYIEAELSFSSVLITLISSIICDNIKYTFLCNESMVTKTVTILLYGQRKRRI